MFQFKHQKLTTMIIDYHQTVSNIRNFMIWNPQNRSQSTASSAGSDTHDSHSRAHASLHSNPSRMCRCPNQQRHNGQSCSKPRYDSNPGHACSQILNVRGMVKASVSSFGAETSLLGCNNRAGGPKSNLIVAWMTFGQTLETSWPP